MTIQADSSDKCPHCRVVNRFEAVPGKILPHGSPSTIHTLTLSTGRIGASTELKMCKCTECHDVVIFFKDRMIYPLGSNRSNAPIEVAKKHPEVAEDFNEACLVEPLSKKAAAALARRCLQNVLHEQGIKGKDLNEEIEKVIPILPSHLSGEIDAVRNIGNFATHPIKYKQTGQIVDVEEGETEWILNVLEGLFDFYYVAPERSQARKTAINTKLQAAGKPVIK